MKFEYYVKLIGNDVVCGDMEYLFVMIFKVVQMVFSGDMVIVYEGVYCE